MRDVVVVMPCYREPIDEVARSVQSALAVRNVTRVVIADDGAHDDSLDRLRSHRIEVLHLQTNGGPSSALDAGIACAPVGSVICRLDVRDAFYADAKARQIETVLSGACRASFSPHFDPVDGKTFVPPPNWQKRIYTDSCFTGVSTVYERSVWEEVGIDTSIRWAEDWRFSMLIQHHVGFDMFPEVTCSAGMFPGGHTDCTKSEIKKQRRDADRARVLKLGRILSHPAQYAHLYSEDWCRKRGVRPLKRAT